MNARAWACRTCIGFAFACLSCSGNDEKKGETLVPQDATIAQPGDASDGGISDASDAAWDGPVTPPFYGPIALSETGLYWDLLSKTVAPGVMAFDVRYPLWSDGAAKKRWLQLPPGGVINTANMDLWAFPVGTKAWKEFYVGNLLVETRFLHKQSDGWLAVSYLWNDDGSDAYAIPEGIENAAGTTHDVPSIDQCAQCHSAVGDVLIGVSAIQLSKEAGGGFISTLIADGKLSNPPAAELQVPGDGVVEDAIGYLHGNCGNCHNNESFLAATHGLRLKLLTGATTPEETGPYQTAINKPTAHDLGGTTLAIVPGQPDQSQLFYRMGIRDENQMPPTGSEIVDPTGLATIEAFITQLPP